jgi:5'-nucleotidase
MVMLLRIFIIGFLCSCSNLGVIPDQAFQTSNPNQMTIAVVGINDFHGSILPREKKVITPRGEMKIYSGGAPALASMLSILNHEMNGNVIIVDAGDEWQGTLESNLVKGRTVVDYFNRIGVKAAAIGNHEFDFNIAEMTNRFSEASYPYLSANIFEKKTGNHPKWKNYFPNHLINVNGIRIGVIGLSTINTPATTRYENVQHLEFRDPAPIVLKEAEALRSQGANAVLVTAHAGTFCDRKELFDWKLHRVDQQQGKCSPDEITNLAKEVGASVLDGIISGHTHQVIHHWISGIPTVQDEAYNQHFNIIYYTFDRGSKKLIPELTRIEGLIPICEKMFEGLSHCDVRRLTSGELPALVPATFHGKKIVPDEGVLQWMKPIIAGTEKYRSEVVAVTELPLPHYRDRESPLGNLVADAMREKGKADFAIINSGGIRISLDAGKITMDDLFRALPFDNLLNVVKMKGHQVKLMYQIATSGHHGVTPVSGLKVKLIPMDHAVPERDLNGDGNKESWEQNHLLELFTEDGKPLKDDRDYTVATYDYLVNGGDDLKWFMDQIPQKDIVKKSGYARDLMLEYLKKRKRINTVEQPLLNPNHPRIVIQD